MTQNAPPLLDRVAIVGAGPAGLATARALAVLGIPFTVFERHHDVGGIWDIANEGSPMYRSAHFISSKTQSGHEGFPMPDAYPDYPSHRQVLAYVRDFARTYDLYEHVRFRTAVDRIERTSNGWTVTSTTDGRTNVERYRFLVAASGTNWHPNLPELNGRASFRGEVIHSVAYRDPEIMRGKRVLVVGAGNSGVDIACDAAFAAEQGFVSFRRGYHFIPKHIFGIPADVFSATSKWAPVWLMQFFFGLLLRVLLGDLTRLGLKKPDHKVLASHPIMNTQTLHYLQHGDLIAKPDVAALDGDEVVFVDGSREKVDLVILATGYRWHIPYLPASTFVWRNDRPRAFLKIFHPTDPTLFLNGFVETNSGAYKLFDEMGLLIAQAIEAQRRDPALSRALQKFVGGREPDLGGGVRYVASARHTGYTNVDAFRGVMASMRKRFGWPTPTDFFTGGTRITRKNVARPTRSEAEVVAL